MVPSTATAAAALVAGTALLFVFQVFKRYILRSPLDNVPGPPSSSFLKGDLFPLLFDSDWTFLEEIAEKYGSVVKVRGLLGSRMLSIYDPKALRHLILEDQDVLEPSSLSVSIRKCLFGPGILGSLGETHRRQRKLLNPAFSTAQIRQLTPTFYDAAHRLCGGISRQLKSNREEIDVLRWTSRAALELVGQGGFGHSLDRLAEDVPNAFGDATKQLGPASESAGIWRTVFMLGHNAPLPALVKRFLVGIVPNDGVKEVRDAVDTMHRVAHEIYDEKRRALCTEDEALKQRIAEGKDVMSVLLRANKEAAPEDRLYKEEVVAQIATLAFAGTESTSAALSRTLQTLAERQDVQDKLRREVINARNGQDISYDALMELPLLDAVCKETLRLYPPVPLLRRGTARDAVVPLSEPLRGVDGSLMNEIIVPKGTMIAIDIHTCNRSKAIWGEDAHEWKPERWLSPLPGSVVNARVPGVFSNLMTFMGGSRSCIGFGFAQFEMKVLLSVLLKTFKFTLPVEQIVWNRSSIVYPTVGRGSQKPALPLRIELFNAVDSSSVSFGNPWQPLGLTFGNPDPPLSAITRHLHPLVLCANACYSGFKFALSEIEMTVLLETFKFGLSEKEIIWNWGGVAFPTAEKESSRPDMLLRVEFVNMRSSVD